MSEPGLDLHEWESRWASIADDRTDDPNAALAQSAELVADMLRSRGYDLDDPVQRSGDDPEIMRTYLTVREVAERAELGDATRDEVETALDDVSAVYATIVTERP
jgi:hypothetical protein